MCGLRRTFGVLAWAFFALLQPRARSSTLLPLLRRAQELKDKRVTYDDTRPATRGQIAEGTLDDVCGFWCAEAGIRGVTVLPLFMETEHAHRIVPISHGDSGEVYRTKLIYVVPMFTDCRLAQRLLPCSRPPLNSSLRLCAAGAKIWGLTWVWLVPDLIR